MNLSDIQRYEREGKNPFKVWDDVVQLSKRHYMHGQGQKVIDYIVNLVGLFGSIKHINQTYCRIGGDEYKYVLVFERDGGNQVTKEVLFPSCRELEPVTLTVEEVDIMDKMPCFKHHITNYIQQHSALKLVLKDIVTSANRTYLSLPPQPCYDAIFVDLNGNEIIYEMM